MLEDRIIQIMPAPDNLYVVYDVEGKDLMSKILCLGLTAEGNILFLDVCEQGIVEEVRSVSNFKSIIW